MELGSAGHNLFLASDLPAIIKWLLIGTCDLPFIGRLSSLSGLPGGMRRNGEGRTSYLHA